MKKYKLSFILLFSYLFLIPVASSIAQELTPEQIYEKVNDCVVVILSYDFNGENVSQGSGVVISEKGWVVTNYHVFAECERMEVKHNDKIIKYTDIIGVDVEKDILILKIEDNTFPSIPIGNSDNLKVGQRIYALGSPLGFENSLSDGIISGIRNIDIKNKNYIQITASIASGSSGGAVVNNRGELIGISTMTFNGGQNLNFAIPINDIMLITLGSYSDKKHIDANNNFYKGYNADLSENYKEAIKYYTNYLDIFPNEAKVYNNRGSVYALGLQDYKKAIIDYNRAIELNPNLEDAYYNRGIVYSLFLQDDSKALSDFNKAIGINPIIAEFYNNRGIVYYNQHEYSKAISDFTKTIELNANNAEAYYNRGHVYSDLKEYAKAIIDFNKAIEIISNYEVAYLIRGIAYYKIGDKIKSCDDWLKAYSLGIIDAKDLLDKYCK